MKSSKRKERTTKAKELAGPCQRQARVLANRKLAAIFFSRTGAEAIAALTSALALSHPARVISRIFPSSHHFFFRLTLGNPQAPPTPPCNIVGALRSPKDLLFSTRHSREDFFTPCHLQLQLPCKLN